MIKAYFDAEFTQLVKSSTLISLGIVFEGGDRMFYAEFTDYDKSLLDDWLDENVISTLLMRDKPTGYSIEVDDVIDNDGKRCCMVKGDTEFIRHELEKYIQYTIGANAGNKVEFYSDCLAYDWVLLMDLWGGAMKAPEYIYYIPVDLCTALKLNNIDPDINREEFIGVSAESAIKHNALWDAMVIEQAFKKLTPGSYNYE